MYSAELQKKQVNICIECTHEENFHGSNGCAVMIDNDESCPCFQYVGVSHG